MRWKLRGRTAEDTDDTVAPSDNLVRLGKSIAKHSWLPIRIDELEKRGFLDKGEQGDGPTISVVLVRDRARGDDDHLHPPRAQVAERKGAEAFRQRLSLRAGQQAVMGECRRRAPQRLDPDDRGGVP